MNIVLQFIKEYYKQLIVFASSIILIFIVLLLYPNYILVFTASLFLLIPYLFGKGIDFGLNVASFVKGFIVSVVIISIYLLLYYSVTKNSINISALSFNLILIHLIVIAFPEEVFFRGYLQHEFGNDLKSIIIVSVLFALGHFLTICIAKSSLGMNCITALLTFFPSLIMGYLYYKSRTIWECTIFHFLSNLAFISTGGFSIFY